MNLRQVRDQLRRLGARYCLDPADRALLNTVWLRLEDATLRLEAKAIIKSITGK